MKKFLFILVAGLFFAPVVFASPSLGSIKEKVYIGKTISVGLSTSGSWYVGSISVPTIISAKIDNYNLFITGKTAGSAKALVCTDSTSCLEVKVMVSPLGLVLGEYTVAPHAVKSWLVSGKTIFYVSSVGLIPVSTQSIFSSNGGKQSLVQPVNDGDLDLPLQSLMTLKDPRVK
jgi:hypothetical protein